MITNYSLSKITAQPEIVTELLTHRPEVTLTIRRYNDQVEVETNSHEVEQLSDYVERRDNNLYVAGTRLTLYQIIDYLKAGWEHSQILEMHDYLNEKSLDDILYFIESNLEMVEAEYSEVLRRSEANRAYWQAYNRERFEKLALHGENPKLAAFRAKLKERQTQ